MATGPLLVAQRGRGYGRTPVRPTRSGCRPTSTPSSVVGAHRVELDPVDEGGLVYRPRVRGAVAQGLAVGLAGAPDVPAAVIAPNGTSSMASTSIRPGPTR